MAQARAYKPLSRVGRLFVPDAQMEAIKGLVVVVAQYVKTDD